MAVLSDDRTITRSTRPSKRGWFWLTVLVVLVFGVMAWTIIQKARQRAEEEYHEALAQIAAAQGDWAGAAAEARALLEWNPKSDAAWLLLSDAEFRRGNIAAALDSVLRVPSNSPNGALARLLEGTLHYVAGQGRPAEAAWKESLRIDPRSIDARRRLVFLYAVELRRPELRRVLWELDELGAIETRDLVLLSGSTFIVWNATELQGTIEKLLAGDPEDVAVRLAAGRYRRRQNDLDGAQMILKEACRLAPADPEARAALIECLIDCNELNEARGHLVQTPPSWNQDSRLTYLRGRVAEESDDADEAIGAYRQSVAGDPDYREAQYHLGQLLLQCGQSAEAEPYLKRAEKLAELEILLGTLVDTRRPAEYAPAVARLELELGHEELASAWYSEAVRLNPSDAGLRAEAARLARRGSSSRKPHGD